MDSRKLNFSSVLLLAIVVLLPLSANASSKLYIVYMGEKKHHDPVVVTSSHHDALTTVLGSKDEALKSIVYSYKHGFSGFAAMLTESQAEQLASIVGIVSVKANTYHETHTTRSWDFLGLNYYDQPSGLLQRAKYGEDIIVGVVDTGIWPESESFNDTGYGPVPARWKGICQTGAQFGAESCNRKIIGARWYAGGVNPEDIKGEYMSPRDLLGHGTHTASTVAGVPVSNVSLLGSGLGAGVARGGAPRARLAVYKACWTRRCGDAEVLAAIDDAINDGVDVLSLSLAGPDEFPGTLHAVARGITVVFSAGNSGPVPQTVQNAVPWVITVAAGTVDRAFPTMISLGNDEKLVGQSIFYDTINGSHFRALVDGLSCNNESLASINITGKVVLCYMPSQAAFTPPRKAFPIVVDSVMNAGGKGLIFAQYTTNLLEGLYVCKGIPCVLVDFEISQRIVSYMKATKTPSVKISPATTIVGKGVLSPRIAAFSARGPSAAFPDILKPDIAAPGVSILAAKGNSYMFDSGTSMACPHVSAIVTLLKSVHPDWSPAMIKSAIITTASITDHFGASMEAEGVPRKLTDPFDYGGGYIDPTRAADPGLVYDINPIEYTKFFNYTLSAFDDYTVYNGRLYHLNLPSIAVPDLKNTVTVHRTVTNVGPPDATYRAMVQAPVGVHVFVEPMVIVFSANASSRSSVTFKVTFKAARRVQAGYTFGSLTWSDGRDHSVRIPIAVRTVIRDFYADTA